MPSLFISLPPHPHIPPLEVITEPWVGFLVLYSSFPLALSFTHGSVYKSALPSDILISVTLYVLTPEPKDFKILHSASWGQIILIICKTMLPNFFLEKFKRPFCVQNQIQISEFWNLYPFTLPYSVIHSSHETPRLCPFAQSLASFFFFSHTIPLLHIYVDFLQGITKFKPFSWVSLVFQSRVNLFLSWSSVAFVCVSTIYILQFPCAMSFFFFFFHDNALAQVLVP